MPISKLAQPAVRGQHGVVGVAARFLERLDERRPSWPAATEEAVGLVGHHRPGLAGADKLQ